MSRPPIPYAYQACPHRARYRIGRWHWWLTDGETGPELCRGTARTEWGANRRIERALKACERTPVAEVPPATVTAMLAHYAEELHDAAQRHDEAAFWHLAALAEAPYRTGVGDKMRALVDAERPLLKAVSR